MMGHVESDLLMDDRIDNLRGVERQLFALRSRDLSSMGYEAKQRHQQRVEALEAEFRAMVVDAQNCGVCVDEFLSPHPA